MKQSRVVYPAVALSLGIVGLISLACLAMLFWLQPGLPTEPLAEHRMAYIAGHPLQWKLGWALWMGSALGFLLFCHWLAVVVDHFFRRVQGLREIERSWVATFRQASTSCAWFPAAAAGGAARLRR